MVKVVLFDLGNTLISYYTRDEFPGVLENAIENCITYLSSQEIGIKEDIWINVQRNNHESPENRVRPLGERLGDIFSINDPFTLDRLCGVFMEPLLKTGRLHGDVIPTLKALKKRGYFLGLISNTPWGCPSRIWRRELIKHGLQEYLDVTVFCVDVGWRKPDERIFQHALDQLDVSPSECLFIGDDPRWDIAGPETMGIKSLLIDRTGKNSEAIHRLEEILNLL